MISKSLFFISCILIIFSTSVKSQFSTGVTIGYSNNQLSTDISNRTFTRNKNYGGFCMELIFGNSLSRLVSFRTGIGFLQKNFSFKRTDKYAGVFETFTNSYIQFPLVGQIKIIEIKRLCVSLSTGFYGAYWAYAKVCGATPNIFDSSYGFDDDGQMVQYLSLTSYSEKYQFNNTKDNRFEFGITTGLDLNYKINDKYSIILESSYYQSLTDQQKHYMIHQVSKINKTICISTGCLIRFSTINK